MSTPNHDGELTILEIEERFKDGRYKEYRQFNKLPKERRRSNRPDLCAFLILSELCPKSNEPIIAHDMYGKFLLNIAIDDLAGVATDEDLLDLSRCGVAYDDMSGRFYIRCGGG